MGPLLLDVPEVPNVSFSNKKLNVLSEKSNAWDEFERQNGNKELGCSSQSVWSHSSLLNEVNFQNLFLCLYLATVVC